jgi:hypothetical protein
MDYRDKYNDQPKPYVWTKTAAEIFTKVARAKQALESHHWTTVLFRFCDDPPDNGR